MKSRIQVVHRHQRLFHVFWRVYEELRVIGWSLFSHCLTGDTRTHTHTHRERHRWYTHTTCPDGEHPHTSEVRQQTGKCETAEEEISAVLEGRRISTEQWWGFYFDTIIKLITTTITTSVLLLKSEFNCKTFTWNRVFLHCSICTLTSYIYEVLGFPIFPCTLQVSWEPKLLAFVSRSGSSTASWFRPASSLMSTGSLWRFPIVWSSNILWLKRLNRLSVTVPL